jgi:hypothetical protein
MADKIKTYILRIFNGFFFKNRCSFKVDFFFGNTATMSCAKIADGIFEKISTKPRQIKTY